ncbi:MAG: hypothetical protein RLZ14_507 [Actinomycetota bacterium]
MFKRRKVRYPHTVDISDVVPVATTTKFSGVFAGVEPSAPPPPPVPQREKKDRRSSRPVLGPDISEFLSLRNELMEIKARLQAAEQARAIVESRLAALDATTLALSNQQQALVESRDGRQNETDPRGTLRPRLDEIEARIAEMASRPEPVLPPPSSMPPPPLTDEANARIDELAERVASVEALGTQLSQLSARVMAQAEFGAQLSTLRDRIVELQTAADATPPQPAAGDLGEPNEADRAAIDELRGLINALSSRVAITEALADQLGQLAERVTTTDATTRRSAEQVAALEQRLDSVGTELANQLSELGRDIDGLAKHAAQAASGTVDDAVIESLRNGQIKLANEQARYEIAFREDLAVLAENLRKPKA